MIKPTVDQMRLAVRHLVEAVDCIGDQLLHHGDNLAALYAALLLNHLRTARPELLAANPRWPTDRQWGLEMYVADKLHEIVHSGQPRPYMLHGLDELIRQVTAIEDVTKLIRGGSPPTADLTNLTET